MATWNDLKTSVITSEGNIPHLSLDTRGFVTVGVGHMLPNAAAATALGFVDRQTNRPATRTAIEADYAAVKARPKGLRAEAYAKFTALDLPQRTIDALLEANILTTKRELVSRLPRFNTYPMTAQLAITDLAFNLGTPKLFTKFPNFKAAIEAEDWSRAATESHRKDPGFDRRNALVKTWLLEAAKALKPTLTRP